MVRLAELGSPQTIGPVRSSRPSTIPTISGPAAAPRLSLIPPGSGIAISPIARPSASPIPRLSASISLTLRSESPR